MMDTNGLIEPVRAVYQTWMCALPRLMLAVVLIIAVSVICRLVHYAVARVSENFDNSQYKLKFWSGLFLLLLWLTTIYLALTIVFTRLTNAGALGLMFAGLVIATLVASRLIENAFCRMVVLWRQPIKSGDVVDVDDVVGTVAEMERDGILIKQWDGDCVAVPYALLWQAPYQVFPEGERRLSIIFAIDHDEPIDQVQEVIQKTVESKKMVGVKGGVAVEVTGMTHGHTEFALSWYCDASPRAAKASFKNVTTALEHLLTGPIVEPKKTTKSRKRNTTKQKP